MQADRATIEFAKVHPRAVLGWSQVGWGNATSLGRDPSGGGIDSQTARSISSGIQPHVSREESVISGIHSRHSQQAFTAGIPQQAFKRRQSNEGIQTKARGYVTATTHPSALSEAAA